MERSDDQHGDASDDAALAHDLNNIIGVILNYCVLLERRVTDPVARADINEIRTAAERGAARLREGTSDA